MTALDRRGWVKREVLALELGISVRRLRQVAEHSDGQIVGLDKGLARVDQISVADAEHAAKRIEAQGRKMQRRAQEIRRAMHRRYAA